MTDRPLDERLRRWHLAEAESSSLSPTLRTALDQLVDAGSAAHRARVSRPLIVILVALLLLTTVLGAIAVGSQVLRLDRSLELDPGALDPCRVLPGPGLPTTGAPNRHSAPQIVGGDACAYGWDDGTNTHLQLRNTRTGAEEAAGIAARLFDIGDGEGPTALVVAGYPAWLGRARWSSADERACAAMAVAAGDVFFVVWLTCRDELPLQTDVAWQEFRDELEAIGSRVVANLMAFDAGRPPVFALDHDGRGIGSE